MDALSLLKEVSERHGINGRIVEAVEDAASLVGEDADLLDDKLIKSFIEAPSGIFEPCSHIIKAGGKRIRPLLCMLVFRAVGGKKVPMPMDLAVVCELLHNATLLHDDVIDEGEMRRGRPTARVVHGNAISVLGGDYLLVKTVEIVSNRGGEYMDFFVHTMRSLINGELVQLKRRGSVETTEEEYFRIIEGKTASLFRWAAYSAGLAAGADKAVYEKLGLFGWHTGIAFQLVDDVLDFTADATQLGKCLLADIREGKMTLPVILAGKASKELRGILSKLTNGGDPALLAPRVAELVNSTGVVAEAREIASKNTSLAINALEELPDLDTNVKRALKELCLALLERKS